MKFIRTLPLLFLTLPCHSQQEDLTQLQESYSDYFEMSGEAVHLHLNKTVYLKGEDIWFSAYLYDINSGEPSKETTNLYCGIYDSEGRQLTKELFHIENGVGSGHFKVESTLGSGERYIKAGTHWMKNFKQDNAFVQKLTILDNVPLEENEKTTKDHDIQFLPEGGHMVEGLENSIGFRVIDQDGKGIAVKSGQVVDDQGQVVATNLKSNPYGIGKFRFIHGESRKYTAQMELMDGDIIQANLPQAEDKGITLTINNLLTDRLPIVVEANKETQPEVRSKNFHLAIHRNGRLTLNTFRFKKGKKTIFIGKDQLLAGINILTLFDDKLNPIAERLFFNKELNERASVSALVGRPQDLKDSVNIKLKLYSQNRAPAQLSISVLPEESLANTSGRSIFATFLLDPYIKSAVDNPAYYFQGTDRKKSFELDNLLLTQGWSSYDWKDIFNGPHKENIALEKGIQINGKLLNVKYHSDNRLMVSQGTEKGFLLADLDENNEFVLEHLHIFKGDSLNLKLFNKKGGAKRPKPELGFLPKMESDSLMPLKRVEYADTSEIVLEKPIEFKTVLENNIVELEGVTVTEDKLERKRNGLTIGLTGKKITFEDVQKGLFLRDWVRRFGFKIGYDKEGFEIILARRFMDPAPTVYVDGQLVMGIDPGLWRTPTDRIDEIYYDSAGMSLEGNRGGAIHIYMKYGSIVGPEPSEKVAKVLITEGFSRPKKYYNPKYSSYNSQDYLEYGTVHWEPSLHMGGDGTNTLTFPDYGLENVKLFIEGMAQDGTLISEIKTLSLN